MKHYQFYIKFTDHKNGKVHELYANRSQVGPEDYALECMGNKLDWLKDRARNFNRDITINSACLIPV